MAHKVTWIGLGIMGAALLTACPQTQSQAFRPVPEPTAVPSGTPYLTTPALPADLALVPKVDEAALPGGGGDPTIPLFLGHLDSGSGTSQQVGFYVFAIDDKTYSQATVPSTYFQRPTAMWEFVQADGSPVAGQLPVFSAVPGEAGYLPYYQVHRVTVPQGYQANQIRDHRTVLRALGTVDSGYQETVLPVAVNHPIVAEGARLQGAEGVRPAQGWYMGRRAYYFTFDTQPVKDNGTIDLNTAYAPDREVGRPPAGYDTSKELPRLLPFFTQAGPEGVATDLIFDTAPQPTVSTPAAPETSAYSAIKGVVRYPLPQDYRFGSITGKGAIPNLSQVPPAKVWLNAPYQDTLVR